MLEEGKKKIADEVDELWSRDRVKSSANLLPPAVLSAACAPMLVKGKKKVVDDGDGVRGGDREKSCPSLLLRAARVVAARGASTAIFIGLDSSVVLALAEGGSPGALLTPAATVGSR